MEEIEVTARFCHPYMNFGGDGCNEVILKYPPLEAKKLVTAVVQKGGETAPVQEVDYSQYAGFWAVSFGVTLSIWIFAHCIGVIISFLKRL